LLLIEKGSFERISIMPSPQALDDTEVQALKNTLDDEYKSREIYAHDFGEVRPFINIVEAEARHVSALLNLIEKYNVSPPANRWAGKAHRFSNVHEACVAGVQGEIENVAIYDRALKSTRCPVILAVYQMMSSTG